MNHTYRLVWNEATQRHVPAAETTRARRKSSGSKAPRVSAAVVAAVAGAMYVTNVSAGPTGGTVVSGAATIDQAGVTTTVNQSSQNVIVNWSDFSIDSNETVQFVQPTTTAVALNRVTGANASQIFGNLQSNGQVFLINPNGVVFGATATVDVGGLVASTLELSDQDFLAGRYRFQSPTDTPANVINQGSITAHDGGAVALLGGQVSNSGAIQANLGTVALAAGNRITLDFSQRRLLDVQVDATTVNALAQNQNLIRANGGTVIMTAAARNALLDTVVNQTGVIEARTLSNENGEIRLIGGTDGGVVNVAGTLDASAPTQGNGGVIETSGTQVRVTNQAIVTTSAPSGRSGTWTIDSANTNVDGGMISGNALGAALERGNVSLANTRNPSGDIDINGSVSWSAANKLSIASSRNINLGVAIANAGSPAGGGVTLRADTNATCVSGSASCGTVQFIPGAGSVTAAQVDIFYNPAGSNNAAVPSAGIGPVYSSPTDYASSVTGTLRAYMMINDVYQLQAIRTNLGGTYALGRDIDARPIATSAWQGLRALGDDDSPFLGLFDGRGHTISDATISPIFSGGSVGLFGHVGASGVVRNVDLVNIRLQSGSGARAGTLAGYNAGLIENVSSTRIVLQHDAITVGGLVGENAGTIRNAYVSGAVTGVGSAGGLVGGNFGTVINTQAAVTVTGTQGVGGLVGVNAAGVIANSTSSGAVTGTFAVGGLVGENAINGTIANSYVTGAVQGVERVGGLLGFNNGGTVNTVYSTGTVAGTTAAGGLVGLWTGGTVINGYWDTETSGRGNSNGGLGRIGMQLFTQANYGGWDFDNVWYMVEGQMRPILRTEYSANIRTAHQLQLMQLDLNADYTLANDIDMSELTRAGGAWNVSNGFIPIGSLANPFTGSLDGRGKTIDGLIVHRPGSDTVGLFGALAASSEIRHVGLSNAAVHGRNGVGALAGVAAGVIDSVYGNVRVGGNDRVGGLVGEFSGAIKDSYVLGLVIGSDRAGGMIGLNAGGDVTGSYSASAVEVASRTGGLIGASTGGSVRSSFFDTDFSRHAISAGGTGATTAQLFSQATYGWDFSNTWFMVEGNTRPFLRWEYSTSIGNSHELQLMAMNLGGTYTLNRDFDLSDLRQDGGMWNTSRGFSPIGANGGASTTFSGRFDGKGHTITGLYINRPDRDSVGLFGETWQNTSVGNINLIDVTVTGRNRVGALMGWNRSLVGNVGIAGSVTGNNQVGGLVGVSSAGISGSRVSGTVTGVDTVGGLVGFSGNELQNSYSTANINGVSSFGGVVGYADTQIANTFYNADVVLINGAHAITRGALHGSQFQDWISRGLSLDIDAYGFVYDGNSNAYLIDSVQDMRDLLGFAWRSDLSFGLSADIDLSSAAGLYIPVLSSQRFEGNGHSITNLAVDLPSVSGVGLFGYINQSVVRDLDVHGSVRGGDAVGGLAGVNNGTITRSSSSVAVTGTSSAGGLVGLNRHQIAESYADGVVIGIGSYAGGLVGANEGSLSNVYATGAVSGSNRVGGLVGINYGQVATAYANNTVDCVSFCGGLVGQASGGSVTSSFYNSDLTSFAGPGTGVTGAQMQQASTFADWSVSATGGSSAIWRIYEGYTTPLLRSLMTGVTIAVDDVVSTYDGTNQLDDIDYHSATSLDPSLIFADGRNSRNVGTYTNLASRLYSGQRGYDLTFSSSGSLTINRADLTLTTGDVVKTYDGTTGAAGSVIVAGGQVFGTDQLIDGSFAFTDKNAGGGKRVRLSGFDVDDGNNGRNYNITYVDNTTSTINRAALELAASGDTKVYDGGRSSDGTVIATGLVAGDSLAANQLFASRNVLGANGSTLEVDDYSITDGNVAEMRDNYDISFTSAAGTITAATLTVDGNVVVASREYDGTTGADVSGGVLNLFGTDVVNLSQTGAFRDANAGGGKAVDVNFAISGADAGNYVLASDSAVLTGNILRRLLSYTASADDKVYDGDRDADIELTLSGFVGNETLDSTATGTFNSKDVATANTVTVDDITLIDGSNGGLASNYTIGTGATTSARITQRALTYTASADDKVYDGTTDADVTLSGLVGLIGNETLGATGTGSFNTKDVVTANTVTVDTAVLSDGSNGGLASNYSIAAGETTSARITQQALTYTASADDKGYDGATDANVTLSGLTGLIGNETLIAAGTGSFNTKDVSTANTVTVDTASLADGSNGGLASNYRIIAGETASARIRPRALTYVASADDKVYDGNVDAEVTLVLQGLIGNETLGSTATGTFNSKDVLTANTVTVDTATLSDGDNGGLASNYSIDTGATTSAHIAAREVTYTASAADKDYDGTTAATVTLSGLAGLIGNETLGATGTGSFNTKDVTTANTVIVDTAALVDGDNGGLASNYRIVAGESASARITPRALTYVASAADKSYDGTVVADVSLALQGLIGSEQLIATGSGSFNSKDVATANTVTVDTAALADGSNGGLASNYSISAGETASARITPRALTYVASADDKIYDGNVDANVSLALRGLVGDETLESTATGAFNSKDVATANTVTVNTASISDGGNGGLASNYSVAAGGTTSAHISARALTYSVDADDKVYDGTDAARVTLNELIGLVGNETLVAVGTGRFNTRDVATANTVTVITANLADGSSGGLASNYSIAAGATDTAHITPATLRVTADDQSRRAGGPNPELTFNYSGFVGGDSAANLSTAPTASTLADRGSNVGDYEIAVSGGAASNYTFAYESGTLTVLAALTGYGESLAHVGEVSSGEFDENTRLEKDEARAQLSGDFGWLKIEDEGMRLPAGVR